MTKKSPPTTPKSIAGTRKNRRRPRVRPHEIVGGRTLKPLEDAIRELHKKPAHGNRTLHADHVLVAHLVAFLSPALKSLRHLEDVFELSVIQKRFGLPRVPKSTLSDAQAIFDTRLLDKIIADLRRRVPKLPHEPQLEKLLNTLTAVDGTFFAMAPRVAWAIYNKPQQPPRQTRKNQQRGNIRIDLHFNVLTGVPEQVAVSDGHTPEYRSLEKRLENKRFYVLDRAYHCYETLAAIVKIKSDFLVRLRADMQFETLKDHPLSAADREAKITRCQTVRAKSARGQRQLSATPLKLVEAVGDDGQILRLLTNRVDLDADLLAMVYRYRWQIELFFRWLKCVVNFRHFFSESENGVALQIGAAVIGTLLIALLVENRPSSYDYAMLSHVMSGLVALDEETLAQLRRRQKERARAAAWQKEYRSRQKSV